MRTATCTNRSLLFDRHDMMSSRVIFREATTSDDLLQIDALNHQTFAEELGQHPANASGLLVDRFHHCNRYFIAVRGGEVIGMISAHPGPEFSVAQKLEDPTVLSRFPNPIEVRLLAIAHHARHRTVLAGLFWMVYEHAVANGHSHMLISGVAERLGMYRKLGFEVLGPAVQAGAATFVPMAMTLAAHAANPAKAAAYQRFWQRKQPQPERTLSLLPGPVEIAPSVREAFREEPISHRSESFVSMYEETRACLRSLGPGLDVAIFPGAGTLANDVVAANLKAIFADAPGWVVSNGEFGERLAMQAAKAGLQFVHQQLPWGQPWDCARLDRAMVRPPAWIWAVHLETSTGALNDVQRLAAIASRHGALLALDCVSSLGAVPIPAGDGAVHFITGVSGKALGSYAGLGFIYLSEYARALLKDLPLCPSFDVVRMTEARGPCTTVPSPLLLALREALQLHYSSPGQRDERFRAYAALGRTVRGELTAAGLDPLCRASIAAPTITTFALPYDGFASDCLRTGYCIAHESAYLQARGWAQIATMGNVYLDDLDGLFRLLRAQRAMPAKFECENLPSQAALTASVA